MGRQIVRYVHGFAVEAQIRSLIGFQSVFPSLISGPTIWVDGGLSYWNY